jgi:hypothetical protein
MVEPLELLARDDKWSLGCGDGAIFAPAAPLWLDVPGFWDGGTIYQTEVAPLFTVAVLDEEGKELALKLQSRRWTPAELTLEYRLSNGVTATEVRTVHPGGVFISEWRLRALRTARVQMVAWTAQPDGRAPALGSDWPGTIRIERPAADADGHATPLVVELSMTGVPSSWGAYVGASAQPHPRWAQTQFPERWRGEGLPRELRVPRDATGGTLVAAVHRACMVGGNGASATFAMRVVPAREDLAPREAAPPVAGRQGTLGGVSRRRWDALLGTAPTFRCSDPYLETCYWYRWSGIWLNSVTTAAGAYQEPVLCEGPGERHMPRAAAIGTAVRELRWLDDPGRARGALRVFLARQGADGALPARVPLDSAGARGWEPAPWGEALAALDASAPDDAFLAEVYRPLAKHAEWLVRERDRDATGMFDAFADPAASEGSPRFAGRPLGSPLKAIEATTWAYTLFRTLERVAPRAGAPDDALRWRVFAERTMRAVREKMWDPAEGLFRDFDARAGERSHVRAAAGFLVYATDLANADHLSGLERNLLDPDRFWTAFPVPSVSLDDLSFTPYGERGGEGDPAPRGGRAIPFTTSAVIDAAARAAVAYAPHLRPNVATLLHRFVRLLFHDGDLGRPNCYPDYNPFTGHPSLATGADDHLLAAVNDLIIQYVLGIRPHANGITIDPFPFALDHAELRGVHVRGKVLDVVVSGERVSVTADGVKREERLGTRMEL